MKFIIFSCLTFIFAPCSYNIPQKTENFLQPVAEISSTRNNAVKDVDLPTSVAIETENPWIEAERRNKNQPFQEERIKTGDPWVYSSPNQTKINEEIKQSSKKRVKNGSRSLRISDLEKQRIPKDDLEIRLWQFSDLFMRIWKDLGVETGVFILQRTNGIWSAKVIRNTVKYNKEVKIEKPFNNQLNEPESGWANIWEKLVEEGVLTLPDGVDIGDLPSTDGGSVTIETKHEGNYRIYTYYSGDKEIKEFRQMAKIIKIIRNEFNLEDF